MRVNAGVPVIYAFSRNLALHLAIIQRLYMCKFHPLLNDDVLKCLVKKFFSFYTFLQKELKFLMSISVNYVVIILTYIIFY